MMLPHHRGLDRLLLLSDDLARLLGPELLLWLLSRRALQGRLHPQAAPPRLPSLDAHSPSSLASLHAKARPGRHRLLFRLRPVTRQAPARPLLLSSSRAAPQLGHGRLGLPRAAAAPRRWLLRAGRGRHRRPPIQTLVQRALRAGLLLLVARLGHLVVGPTPRGRLRRLIAMLGVVARLVQGSQGADRHRQGRDRPSIRQELRRAQARLHHCRLLRRPISQSRAGCCSRVAAPHGRHVLLSDDPIVEVDHSPTRPAEGHQRPSGAHRRPVP
mmetsp:Transcript_87814/g.273158  ORF Transcript_87814/g.273158 Transcript_87814/m.273158 type:complete len:271 (-) Transcript_87814:46-858(-)